MALIKRTYRITLKQDKKIKHLKKMRRMKGYEESESDIIRTLIENAHV